MTGNQVARMSAEYAKAHNEATEAISQETNRINAEHYERMDNINKSLADIEQQKANTDQWYKEMMIKITEPYYTKGRDIESERNHIQQEYNTKMANLEQQRITFESTKLDETERHNREMETLEWSANALKDKSIEYENRLKTLEVRYQKEYWDSSVLASWANINNAATKLRNDYQLGMMGFQNEYTRLGLDYLKYQANLPKIESEVWRNKFEPIANAITGSIQNGIKALPFLLH